MVEDTIRISKENLEYSFIKLKALQEENQKLKERLKTIRGLTLKTGDERLEFIAKLATI